MEIRIPNWGPTWRQIGGDMNPGTYGATIAQADGSSIELFQIQPVRENVGDREAVQVGFPFWSKEGYYDLADMLDSADYRSAMSFVGLTKSELEDMKPDERAVAIALALFDYGSRTDPGPSGWAQDVLGDRRVHWWGLKKGARPQGWRYIADEDKEFRRLLRDNA